MAQNINCTKITSTYACIIYWMLTGRETKTHQWKYLTLLSLGHNIWDLHLDWDMSLSPHSLNKVVKCADT
jgi:hypothetical protein